MIPYKNTITMDEQLNEKLNYLEYLITIIFIIDLITGFRKGYISEKTGEHVTSASLIAVRYIKFYFWIDLLGCIPFGKFSDNRMLRLIPLIKTLRLFRLKKLIHLLGFQS